MMLLSRKEIASLGVWLNKHIETCTADVDVVFEQTSASGIGTNTYASCNLCKDRCDITDYSAW